MLKNLFTRSVNIEPHVFSPSVILLQPVEVVKDGRLSRTSEFKPFDISDSLREFKSSDFSIGSLQAVGALSKLKTTYMANTSSMNIADSFENLKLESDVL